MSFSLRQILFVMAAISALAVAGCGDSGEPDGEKLPPSASETILAELDGIGRRVAANVSGACNDIVDGTAGGSFVPIDATLSSLSDDVDPDVRSALDQSVQRLKQLVDEECADIQAAEDAEQEALPEETTTEEQTVPEETDTEQTDTETEPETTPDEQPTAPEGTRPPGRGPDGTGPPGQDGGGVEAPSDEGDE